VINYLITYLLLSKLKLLDALHYIVLPMYLFHSFLTYLFTCLQLEIITIIHLALHSTIVLFHYDCGTAEMSDITSNKHVLCLCFSLLQTGFFH